jgi:ABC-type dipeptide/oligopeptide/nickel transport system permease subunit
LFSDGHLLGTGLLGRDLLGLLAHAGWATMLTAVVPVLLATAVGVVASLVARAGHVCTSWSRLPLRSLPTL